MLKLGIDEQWVRLAIETVCTASYFVLINGEPRRYITPSRGIKQGDPLSPYLFLLLNNVIGFESHLHKKKKKN